jgi:hypothetical protein
MIYAGAFFVFLCVGWGLGWIPQPVKDTAAWFGAHIDSLIYLAVFATCAYIVILYLNGKKGKSYV